MEWDHRNWGGSIGAMFILPFAYFGLRGRLSQKTMKRCLGISTILRSRRETGARMKGRTAKGKNEKTSGNGSSIAGRKIWCNHKSEH